MFLTLTRSPVWLSESLHSKSSCRSEETPHPGPCTACRMDQSRLGKAVDALSVCVDWQVGCPCDVPHSPRSILGFSFGQEGTCELIVAVALKLGFEQEVLSLSLLGTHRVKAISLHSRAFHLPKEVTACLSTVLHHLLQPTEQKYIHIYGAKGHLVNLLRFSFLATSLFF